MALHDPLRRTERLIEESAGDDVVIYDRDTDRVTALGATDAQLWRACDGTRSLADLASLTELSEAEAAATLAKLDEAGLLATTGMSRRTLVQRAGLVGAGVGAVTFASVLAPVAAHAATLTPPAGGGGVVIKAKSPLIYFAQNAAITVDSKKGVAVVPPIIGTGFGSATKVSVEITVNGKKLKVVPVKTTDDGSFYLAGIDLSDIRPGDVINTVATVGGSKVTPTLSKTVGLLNQVLGKL